MNYVLLGILAALLILIIILVINTIRFKPIKKEFEKVEIEKVDIENTLSEEQQKVYDDIKKVNAKTSLLYGITGSGKTEIYFKLIEDTIKNGKNRFSNDPSRSQSIIIREWRIRQRSCN
jgi:hypothetical protein